MAFRSSNKGSLSRILENIQGVAFKAKNKSLSVVDRDLTGRQILDYLVDLQGVHAYFEQWKTTPGLAQFSKDQFNDPAYDIVSEFTAMQAAILAAAVEIISTFPKNGGFLQHEQMDAQGVVADRTFTQAQTAVLHTKIQAVIDAID